ncbi:DEAD/DEAH box helicase [Virgibacillus sp. MG-45]|uniref:DEAD/DEAH box helicase n=1 Tax=Virgibacillus sp. MG-45 TaxID=3102791 RepID=UPI002ED84CC5
MKKLSDINLERLFPASVYKRGLQYFKQDRVNDLLFDINHQVWTATVDGTEPYFVEIDLQHMEKGTVDTYCDCPAFDTFQTCKHIVAVLLSVVQKERNNPSHEARPNYKLAEQFMQSLGMIKQQERANDFFPDKKELHIEYIGKWGYEKNLILELKAGENRSYVVKDIVEFLHDVHLGRGHFFTKNFIYSPEHHYILQQDMQILERLFSIVRNEEIYREPAYYHYLNKGSEKRSIVIPPLVAEELLEQLVQRDFIVDNKESENEQPLQIVKDQLPFRFSLSKNEQKDLTLNLHHMEGVTYFDSYQMLYDKGTFYFPSKDQVPIIEQIMKFSLLGDTLPIANEQADMFISEVVPSLKKVSEVDIADNVAADIIQVPLKAKLYLEVKNDWIIGKLLYHYGAEEIDPFNGRKQNDVMIIRDVEKEQKIMQLIEHANFHYNGKELYIAPDDEQLYEFLYRYLPMLDEQVELFLTSELRSMFLETEPTPSTSVRVESANNLLEVGFDIEGVNDDEVSRILDAVIEKKRYYRMQDGAIISLEGEDFSSIKQFFADLNINKDDVQNGNIQMPVYRGMQVDELLDTKKNYDPTFRALLHRLKSPEEQVYPLPEKLHATLRNYQVTGYQWFKSLSSYQLGGILADDMGLGKTLQSIAYIVSEPSDYPHIIVAPSSVVYNWKNEIEKFSPSLSVAIMTGNPVERHARIKQSQAVDVWITSYATLRQDIEIYMEQQFQTLILDEAQFIKNYATKTSQAIRKMKASRRFALSGTPIENSIDELWAIFQVVLPGLMPNQKQFRQLEHEKIASLTKPFILRRLKKDVLKELPDKIESVHVSELTDEQKNLYVGYLRQLQQEAAQSMQTNSFQKNRMRILAGLTRLRQICCHPALFIENYDGPSGKLAQLMETVQNAIENGKRMLIFSQFTSMHEIIIEKLTEAGIGYFYIHGQTAAQERVEMSERFNNGENDVFLISLKAGGTGLNLTGADTVILYDLWWNPAVEDQATGRAHRFGQKNVVQVIRLITEGTIEEKIYDLQQKKRELIDKVIQPGETMLSSLSEADIRELLNI